MDNIQTEIYHLTGSESDAEKISRAARIIAGGGIAAFPTETVYGLGANAFDPKAVEKIFAAKGRPSDNPLIVHIASADMLPELTSELSETAKRLIRAFMPGPFTAVLKKSDRVPYAVTAGLDTVAVRFPSHPAAQALIKAAGVPIAAPSANLSGKPSPTTAKHVIDDLSGRADAILAGGDCDIGVESTVADLTGDVPVILRPGGVTLDMMREIVPETKVDPHVLKSVADGETPRSPGMKYKHYAPNADVTVVEGRQKEVFRKINELLSKTKAENPALKTGVLRMYPENEYDVNCILDGGSGGKEYAKNLFRLLRTFDEFGIDVVFAEFADTDGYGLAVKNRLYKSAGNKVIRV